jgi:Transmembrane protein 131-like N-terminal/Viral BACON domain/Fibronectin type III domain
MRHIRFIIIIGIIALSLFYGAEGVLALTPPGAFSKVSPSNGATNQPKTAVTLSWSGSSGATGYSYCFDPLDRCDHYDYSQNYTDVGSNTSVVVTNLSPGMTYYWQVRAYNTDGITYADGGITSPRWTFTTEVVPPGAFSKISPTNGVTNQPKTAVTLSWGSSSGATGYSYCFDYAARCDFPNDYPSMWTDVGNNTSVVVTNLSPGTTYYWQVRAHNTDGITYANGGTTTWSFITAAVPPPGVLEVAPSGDLVSTGNQGGPFNPLSKVFTVTNTGGESINYTVSKTQPWVSLSSTGGTLSPGGSTTVTVSINGGANSLIPGSYNDTVTITNTTNGNGNTTRSVNLTVNQILFPNISISPISIDFGSVSVNSSSSQVITIANMGTSNLAINSISVTGLNSDMFSVINDTCSSLTPIIAPGGSCTIKAVFSPKSAGEKSGNLIIVSNDPDNPEFDVSLTGTGVLETNGLNRARSVGINSNTMRMSGIRQAGISQVADYSLQKNGSLALIKKSGTTSLPPSISNLIAEVFPDDIAVCGNEYPDHVRLTLTYQDQNADVLAGRVRITYSAFFRDGYGPFNGGGERTFFPQPKKGTIIDPPTGKTGVVTIDLCWENMAHLDLSVKLIDGDENISAETLTVSVDIPEAALSEQFVTKSDIKSKTGGGIKPTEW